MQTGRSFFKRLGKMMNQCGKRTRRTIALLLSLLMVVSTVFINPMESYAATKSKSVKIIAKTTSVKLSQESLALNVGESVILKVTTKPSNATSAITWETSNKSVVTVDKKGKVSAVATGTATITVTANGHKATCNVIVSEVATENQQSTTEGTEATESRIFLIGQIQEYIIME